MRDLSWLARRRWYLSVAIIAIFLIVSATQADQPLIIDEIEFPRLAEAVANTGRPIYYRGEQSPDHIGVFHPPLYAYALGGWMATFGFSEVSSRSFGILLMVGTALVGVRIVRSSGLGSDLGPPLFLALFLFHPFVIQSALLPDIDGTVLLFGTMLLFQQVVHLVKTGSDVKTAAARLGLVLALLLAAKLTSLIVLPAVFAGMLLSRGLRWALAVTGLGFIVGTTVFLAAWGGLAVAADLPFLFPFEFTIQSGLKGGVGGMGLADLVRRLAPAEWTVYWLGVLLPATAVVGTVVLIRQWRTRPDRRVLLMMPLWSLGSIAFYSVITGPPFGFPKYYIAAVPTMAIVGVVSAEFALERIHLRRFALPISGLTLIAMAAVSGTRSFGVADVGRYAWPGYGWILTLLILAVLAGAAMARDWTHTGSAVAILGLSVATMAYSLGMSVSQALQDGSIRYFPGEVGFEETVERLRELTDPGVPILAPKDVGSATYNRYHEQERLFLEPERLKEVLSDENLKYVVVRTDWDYSYKVFPEVEAIIEMEMDLMQRVGDFLIYERVD